MISIEKFVLAVSVLALAFVGFEFLRPFLGLGPEPSHLPMIPAPI